MYSVAGLWFTMFAAMLLAYQVYMILNGITARKHTKDRENLKYTFVTTMKALVNREKRQEMIKGFRDRWGFFFNSKYEFLFCDPES